MKISEANDRNRNDRNRNDRKHITSRAEKAVLMDAKTALSQTLQSKGRGAWVSSHEALGIITEEYHELVEATRNGNGVNNDPGVIQDELMDLVVAGLFALACYEDRTMQW